MSAPSIAFDPLADLFVAQDRRPDWLLPVNLRALSPFHRALLAIDGTVTTFIEAYTMEPVVVEVIDQAPQDLTTEHTWLELLAGSRVIVRQVELRGATTGRLHAHAVSLLAPHRMPELVTRAIDENPRGLGGAMLVAGLETRREVLWYGRERVPDGGPPGPWGPGDCLARTYRVISRDHPIMLITERFPLDDDPGPTHH